MNETIINLLLHLRRHFLNNINRIFMFETERSSLVFCRYWMVNYFYYYNSFTNYRFLENSFLEVKVKPNFGRSRISQFIHYHCHQKHVITSRKVKKKYKSKFEIHLKVDPSLMISS